jgi:EAL domain-containing protein (putative c-di-GMP-specific phosphodiesterase class I)
VDTVKIDRSFVVHAESVEYHRVLIEATIRVAQTLGMTTVAEGIERTGQARLLRQLQCDRGQGYLYSHPLEAEALPQWLRARADRAARSAA